MSRVVHLPPQVAQWQRDKKNLRALLASLHEIAPPCTWKAVGMGELIDPKKVKRHYHKACLAVHPDKQDSGDLEGKVHMHMHTHACTCTCTCRPSTVVAVTVQSP